MDKLYQARKWFIKTALSYLGTPYIWGGDDPSGFDCSGFVVECLKTAGMINENEDYTADRLMRRFTSLSIENPCEGALLFRLDKSGRARHVVICLDEFFQIGASGGSGQTLDLNKAWRDNAFVKIRPLRFNKKYDRLLYLFNL